MDENKTIRLQKVLRELNISQERAVEYLSEKGYKIAPRPTTKITNEMYTVLLEGFQTDRTKRVASEEVGEEKKKEKEKLRLIQETKLEEKKLKEESQKTANKTANKTENSEKEAEKENKTDNKSLEKKDDEKTKDSEKLKTKYKKIDGPKITGIVNLKQFERPKKEKPEEKVRTNKKKRKRIIKPVNQNSKPTEKDKQKGTKTSFDKVKRSSQKIKKEEPTEAEIQKQVRETLEKLQGKSSKNKGAKYRREKRNLHREQTDKDIEKAVAESKILKVTEFVTVSEIAAMMEISSAQIISACMSLGMMVTMNQRLDAETLTIVAEEFNYTVEFIGTEVEEYATQEKDRKEDLMPRAPIITVMGHVDHGKTSLLDYIRKSNVIAKESGGITQHIGAYSVELANGRRISFLDTPGHEAFTAMRARGAQITDLVIIAIAADDDIMPQTEEAISHAQAAGVPIVFAINKIDRPDANPDNIKQKLASMNLLVEDWGGKIQSQDVSAKTGKGIDELLEKVLLEADIIGLKANPNKKSSGTVIEALLDKGRGYVSTIIVQSGTLKIGDCILAGRHSGKVRAMFDERGNSLKFAGPSTPISLLGLDGAPQAGDKFTVFEDEREAKQIAIKRSQLQREQSVRTQKHITLDEIGRRIALENFKKLNIILKGDVDGSVEALTDSFQKLSKEEIQVNIIHKGVGAITESDVLLASASDAIVIGFNVRPSGNARAIADTEEVDIRMYSIIYDAINDLKNAMEGMLSPDMKEDITGIAEIREIYKISKVGNVAGAIVLKGKVMKDSQIRIIRDNIVVFTGVFAALKRFKDDVKEVVKGYDCGIQIKGFNDIKIGDVIEAFREVAIKKKL